MWAIFCSDLHKRRQLAAKALSYPPIQNLLHLSQTVFYNGVHHYMETHGFKIQRFLEYKSQAWKWKQLNKLGKLYFSFDCFS